LAPEHHAADESYQKILEKFSTEKRIQRVEISKLKDFEINLESFHPIESSSISEIALKLKQKFEEI
jgi:hypothetical protein